MPDPRRGRTWFVTLAALVALAAFAPHAAATEYGEPSGCSEPESTDAVISGAVHECAGEEPPALYGPCREVPVARVAMLRSDEGHAEESCLPDFGRSFLARVWKFAGEVDYYEPGELSMTLGKVLNLPLEWRTLDDSLLDQDSTVLVGNRVRVFRDGRRVERDELDAANDVRVHGKLLRPGRWRVDEDGSPVATIRAKKIYITG